jgi:uncharacterized membrane protein
MKLFLLTFSAMIFYSIAEIYSKKYANTGSFSFMLLSCIGYMVVVLLWFPSLQQKNTLSLLNTIWTLSYAIIGIGLGVFLFKEHLNIYNYVGLFLASVALIFLCL